MSELLKNGKDKIGNHTNDNEMIQFWERTGLIYGLNVNLQLKLSKHLDDLALYIIETKIPMSVDGYEGLDVISFPVIRRIYNQAIEDDKLNLLDELDVRNILRVLMITYTDSIELIKKIYGDTKDVDLVATAVSVLSEHIYHTLKYNSTESNP